MKYRIYIDEVGNSDLESSDNPNHRFLSLTGVILELGYVESTVHPEMEALKRKYFGSHPDEPIIFHRKEMVNRKTPFTALRNPELCNKFDKELLSLLQKWEYIVISVTIDKKHHKEQYTKWRYDPYHYCLAVLMERYLRMLEQADVKGDVMAESRGGKEDIRLKDSFNRLWKQGTNYISDELFKERLTSCQLKVKMKNNNISGLQIADLVAHPSRTEILIENNLWEKPLAPFAKRIAEILKLKYYQKENKIYGKKLL